MGEVGGESASTATDAPLAVVAQSARGPESPWRSALRQIWRNRAAMAALYVFVLMVVICLLAPVYARYVAHVNAFTSNLQGTFRLGHRTVHVMQQNTQGLGLGVEPIGPTWSFSHYFLGADDQGRDVFARLLYGGRNSLLISTAAASICCAVATFVGVAAGYFGGVIDWILSRVIDIVWAFPVY
ncbi:MAG: ABC transporter permease, partial [Acidimicrobiales bacterium]